jgi:cytochrome c oxidase assembly factor CtaG
MMVDGVLVIEAMFLFATALRRRTACQRPAIRKRWYVTGRTKALVSGYSGVGMMTKPALTFRRVLEVIYERIS